MLEAVSFLAVLMMLAEAFVDPVGALLPMMAEGLAVLDTVAASAELGVTRGLAIPDPPVMVKYVEKIGWDALAFAMKRTANFSVGERPAIG